MSSHPWIYGALAVVVLETFAAMLAALLWYACIASEGRALLPPQAVRSHPVPWGAGTVALVILCWFAVNILVAVAYVPVRNGLAVAGVGASPALDPGDPAGALTGGKASSGKAPVPRRGLVSRLVGVEAYELSFTEQIGLVSLINLVLAAAVPVIVCGVSGATLADLGLTANGWARGARFGALMFLLLTPLLMAVNGVSQVVWNWYVGGPNLHPLFSMLRNGAAPATVALAYVSAVVLAPLVEELIFRGIIQGWLRGVVGETEEPSPAAPEDLQGPTPAAPGPVNRVRSSWTPRVPSLLGSSLFGKRHAPVVLTSGFFALVHFPQMPAPFAIFVLSVALGILYERTGSLVASFVLHALFNGFNTTLVVFALMTMPPGRGDTPDATPPKAVSAKPAKTATFSLSGITRLDMFWGDPPRRGRVARFSTGPSGRFVR